MKKEIATKWVKALRSGKYKQGTGALCEVQGKTAKYCCLGVLCHILNTPYEKVEDGCKKYEGDAAGLAESVKAKTGIKSSFGKYKGCTNNLADHNDSGKSFKEIANIIEQNWRYL